MSNSEDQDNHAASDLEDDFASPKLDALDRYERMINVQIQTIDGIDDKAEYLTRYLAILIALLFTGASFVVDTDFLEGVPVDLPLIISLLIGLIALGTSLVFSILTYLSSVFQYGPKRDFAVDLANNDVENKLYAEIMLRTYRDAIYENKRVVQQNSGRFKYALTALLNGVVFLAAAAVMIFSPLRVSVVILIATILITGFLTWYILTDQYLTLEREELLDE